MTEIILQDRRNSTRHKIFYRTEILIQNINHSTGQKSFFRTKIILQDRNHSKGQKSFYRTEIILQDRNYSTSQKSFYSTEIILQDGTSFTRQKSLGALYYSSFPNPWIGWKYFYAVIGYNKIYFHSTENIWSQDTSHFLPVWSLVTTCNSWCIVTGIDPIFWFTHNNL